ncbi:MAG TPA: hypothetical protein VFI47_30020 [Acidimicrobiales bacterium]|nr:hypothetical protein [Acidimicrobiales bacterium]
MRVPGGRRALALAAVVLVAVAATACGGDDDEDTATETESSGTTGGPDLTEVCPDPLIVQTDWFPEPEHGGLYQLIGTDGEADAEAGVYTGELAGTGIDLEIRAGGPFLGGQSTSAQMYADPDIFMGYVATDELIKDSGEQPLVSVVSPLEKSPQILMWDPEAFPGIETFADIGATGAPVLYFEGSAYMDFLVGKGFISKDQIDASYDGAPSRFVTEDVFQQGFASNEPYKYENDIEEWGKPVDYLLIHDAGFEIYPSSLAVRPERIAEEAECLAGVVPLMQQAQVDYMADPEPVNDFFLGYVDDMASFWTLSADGNANAVEVMAEEGLVSNGPDGVIGNFDMARVQKLIDETVPIYQGIGVDSIKEGLTAEDIVDNQFIDESVGLPAG